MYSTGEVMNEETEEKINRISAEIDIIESINNTIRSGLFGEDCVTKKDAYNMVSLLENKIKYLKNLQESVTDELKL